MDGRATASRGWGRVPLARRTLLQDRRRAVLSITGVGVSLLLVLLLDGIFAGAMHQVTVYIRNSPADVFVAQQDVRTIHMSQSALPRDVVEEVRNLDGVAWAEGLHYTSSIIVAGDESQVTYVFGYDVATGRGGPHRMVAGEPPGAGQVVVDEVAAGELGVALGDRVSVLGVPFTVSGLSSGGTNIVNTTVFISAGDFAALRGDHVAYVLVGAEPHLGADELAARVAAALPQTTVQTRTEFERQERRIVRDMTADVMAIMTAIGLLIALAFIGLTLFASTLARLREFGVLKALGATSGRLAGTVVAQAAWTVIGGLVVAVALSVGVGAAIDAASPNIHVLIGAPAVARVAVGALAIGALASLVPLRRVARVDPATAFRRS